MEPILFLNRVSQVRILLGALSTSTNTRRTCSCVRRDLDHLTDIYRFWRVFAAASCTLVARTKIMKSNVEKGDAMVTADEIRARVEAADQARIQARAETAAKIAAEIDRRTEVRAELAKVDRAITAGLAESAAIMTSPSRPH